MSKNNTQSKEHNTKKLVLLDAHAIIHRAYHALPDFLSSLGEPTGALYGVANMIMKIITDLKPDYIAACYDLPGKTFRHEAYDEYKGKRGQIDDALITQLKNSRRIFEAFSIPTYDMPGFEADDILGTIVEQFKKDKHMEIIIASGDMDTMQLVKGKKIQVYTLKKGITDTILYDEEKVVERFGFKPEFLPDYKGLRGDPSDNIIGIKGIGEKTATALIVKFGTIENIYKNFKKEKSAQAFKDIGVTPRLFELIMANEEEALFSKTLATIRKDAPIEFTLPTQTFWESVDVKKIEAVFAHFEFRSLITRLKSFFNTGSGIRLSDSIISNNSENSKGFLQVLGKNPETSSESLSDSPVDSEELQETSIALWLINSDILNPTLDDILLYAKTSSFVEAREYIFKKLKENNLEKVYEEIEKPIIPIIKKMQDHGILIDQSYFKKLATEYHAELDVLTQKIYQMAGTEFNINSPKQLGEILFEKMQIKSGKKRNASGNLSTKISVLEELEDDNPIIKEIIAYRELQKLLSTYIDVIPQMADAGNRLHAKFQQAGSATGRFSSTDPNLQNLPIKTELGKRIRNGFVAAKGHKIVAFDYSQIELRVVAILSGDTHMTEIFRRREDIHAGVASRVFGVPLDKVDPEMRRKSKVINFGIIYGMGVTALRKNLGGTREEAQAFYDSYFEQFSGVKDYLENVKKFAMKHTYTETLFGRRRYFPNINSRLPFLKNMAERTATNAPVQGTATADIIKLAIRFAEEDLEKAGLLTKVHLMLQIHDELVYEVEDSVLAQAKQTITKAMETVLERSFLHYTTDIPLIVHVGEGDDFGEVK
jgi:DNA polymerase-1